MRKMKQVHSIGGIFFKCKDPVKMRNWYSTHLWFRPDDNTKKGFTVWGLFSDVTNYFSPSKKDFMVNYRVENLEKLVKELKKEGVKVVDTIETFSYGKFIHILDPEGNKIELWEPDDIEFEKLVKGNAKQ